MDNPHMQQPPQRQNDFLPGHPAGMQYQYQLLLINTAAHPWENIFNSVPGTTCQVKLPDVGARSPLAAVKKLVTNEFIPLINETLMGLSDKEVSRPALLLSKKTIAELATAQGPHRDWPMQRSLKCMMSRLNFVHQAQVTPKHMAHRLGTGTTKLARGLPGQRPHNLDEGLCVRTGFPVYAVHRPHPHALRCAAPPAG
ncbi:hypothetical protein JKP88DRAFT_249603 [Tribonema minus]|uniref:Uncharacterized protein n=1 Tax=Tribonema minus TaxID=303371 RepID=A0A835YIK3_9STRA|nr:hypothetical protein JKP88DRAFT_336129 [Tribonema minus]KAG5176179.1 hypothetical protein JKP88DRAFT_249603 [Tribonema minus]